MPFDIDRQITEWQKSLLDTSKRNRLIKFVSNGSGLPILQPGIQQLWEALVNEQKLFFPWKRELLGLPAEEIDADADSTGDSSSKSKRGPSAHRIRELTALCQSSGRLSLDNILTELTDKKLSTTLLRLSRTSAEAETEHGVPTLFAAFGFLSWYESDDSEEEIRAPLVLMPIQLERETVLSQWTLAAADGDPQPNHCLAELLRAEFRQTLPVWDEGGFDVDDENGLTKYLASVANVVQSMSRWKVVREVVIGVFNFQKLAMWQDLKRNAEQIKGHDLCRAIAGDRSVPLRAPAGMITAKELDREVPPDTVTHILDADSSQHEALEAVKRGANVVIDGPPGTGKSQTIANAIAELLAAGKTVLFVSEKGAALEVVKARLDRQGLGDFCLDLHSHKANKREVSAELFRCIQIPQESYQDLSVELRQLAEDRERLNTYASELHCVRPLLGLSAYQAHGELAQHANLKEATRWSISNAFERDGDFLRRATETLDTLKKCRPVIENPTAHPWRGAKMTSLTQVGMEDMRFHLGQFAKAAARLCEGQTLTDLALEDEIGTFATWQAATHFARTVIALPMIPIAWFKGDPKVVCSAAIELHNSTETARALTPSLKPFLPDSLSAATHQSMAKLASDLSKPVDTLAEGNNLSARERQKSLRNLAIRLKSILPVIAGLAKAIDALGIELKLGSKTHPIHQTQKLVQIAQELANGPSILPTWWDGMRRAELKTVVSRAIADEQTAREIRAKLVAVLSPVAFSPENAGIIREASRQIGSFWKRLLPRWRTVRRQLFEWYSESIPNRGLLQSNLNELLGYHKRAESLAQVEEMYNAEFLKSDSGKPDWALTAEGLKVVERYEKWGLPAALKTALAQGAMDRRSLANAATEAQQAWSTFQKRWAELLKTYRPAENILSMKITPQELASALADDAAESERESAALEILVGMLKPENDLSAEQRLGCPTALAKLSYLRSKREPIAKIMGVEASPEEIEEMDWSGSAVIAQQLTQFLCDNKRSLSKRTVQALTDTVTRNRLREALRVSEASIELGLEISWCYITESLFESRKPVSVGITLANATLTELADWAASRSQDVDRLEEWVRFQQVRRDAKNLGIELVVEEVCAERLSIENATLAFQKRFLGLWLDALYEETPILRDFSADRHDERVERFARLDRRSVALAQYRVRSFLLGHANRPVVDGSAPESSEQGVIMREGNKKRRHLPLRRLFAQVPTLLLRVKPCVMMSPLAVSTYLNSPDLRFDVVIFDEASQVRPHDAVCAVYRGRQLVVAGDPKQLPPSDFFNRSASDDLEDPDNDEANGTADFESLLDVCLSLGLTRKRLKWHYRSRREGLIAFSNKFIYNNDLVTFPSADEGADQAISLERVDNGQFESGVNAVEARRVAELVFSHFRMSPNRSLGVIAFSKQQEYRIEDELEILRKADPSLEDYFKDDRDERFFVKNLERVQGDERDVIFLSIGYGPDAAGKIAMRFGPLNRQGGERRLNVAVTRARSSMKVISTMMAADIDLSRTQAEGPRLLKAFLDYADRGTRAIVEAITAADHEDFDSPFEREVYDELTRRGLTVHRQVGCGGFKIDLAITDQTAAGRYLLGVECDGATYHSSATARDRDRLRQSVLENLGWNLCRIWSTDWLRNREKQVNRVIKALEKVKIQPTLPSDISGNKPINLVPIILPRTSLPNQLFASIDEVPEAKIREAILQILKEFGATDQNELIKSTSLRIGFRRLGSKIESRIKTVINSLRKVGIITTSEDGRVKVYH